MKRLTCCWRRRHTCQRDAWRSRRPLSRGSPVAPVSSAAAMTHFHPIPVQLSPPLPLLLPSLPVNNNNNNNDINYNNNINNNNNNTWGGSPWFSQNNFPDITLKYCTAVASNLFLTTVFLCLALVEELCISGHLLTLDQASDDVSESGFIVHITAQHAVHDTLHVTLVLQICWL